MGFTRRSGTSAYLVIVCRMFYPRSNIFLLGLRLLTPLLRHYTALHIIKHGVVAFLREQRRLLSVRLIIIWLSMRQNLQMIVYRPGEGALEDGFKRSYVYKNLSWLIYHELNPQNLDQQDQVTLHSSEASAD